MSLLHIRLFGPPRIELDGKSLDLDHRKPVALLAYLATTRQLHTRDFLASFLWPESAKPLTYLRNNLWIIRKALGPYGDSLLEIDRSVIGIKPGAQIDLDIERFRSQQEHHDHHSKQNQACEPNTPCPACMERLLEAVNLYTADFMAGFTLRDSPDWDEWHFFQNQQLKKQLSRLLDKLIEVARAQGDLEAAIGYGPQLVSLDPLEEAKQRTLIRLYAESGHWAMAIRQYQECVKVLKSELDVEPEKATKALFAQVKNREILIPTAQPAFDLVEEQSAPVSPSHQIQSTGESSVNSKSQNDAPLFQLLDQFSPLIGRGSECKEIQNQLTDSEAQILTLIGPGGVGKTRLSMQVAANLFDHFPDGSHFVALASIRSSHFVLSAIAQALDVEVDAAIPLEEQVGTYLRGEELLLVLDNFEQVVEAAPLISRLFTTDTKSKVLITSRARLKIREEHIFEVQPLPLPRLSTDSSTPQLSQFDAVRLFIERAKAAKSTFSVDNRNAPAVAEICAYLDGMPLAIELAAARVRLFSPQALLQRLEQNNRGRLKFLRGGSTEMPARHQALHNAIAWSYDLLSEQEKRLFRRLAIFIGGCTLEAAESVCVGLETSTDSDEISVDDVLDLLILLVDKSLISQQEQPDGNPRFFMLETVREFGIECLNEHHEQALIPEEHKGFYLQLAVATEPHLYGENSGKAAAMLRLEHNNIRRAIRYAIESQDIHSCLQFSDVLLPFWTRGYLSEAERYLDTILPMAEEQLPSPAYINALASGGYVAFVSGHSAKSRHLFEKALKLNGAGGSVGSSVKITTAYGLLAWIVFNQGDHDAGIHYHQKSIELAVTLKDDWSEAMVRSNLGHMYVRLGQFEEAEVELDKALAIHQRVGDASGNATCCYNRTWLFLFTQDISQAQRELNHFIRLLEEMGNDRVTPYALLALGAVALANQEFGSAFRHIRDCILMRAKLGGRSRPEEDVLLHRIRLAAAQDEATYAIQLAAGLLSIHKANQTMPSPLEQRLLDEALDPMKSKLAESEIDEAEHAGNQMDTLETIDFALRPPATMMMDSELHRV